eukprot:TRINITY_DN1410_c0_g2_i2.p1 TRINITY_DN1410_c0_g2~~TRINITY_DN1410_c0_g2_i2.p1  ORF type:complete len:302 (+),score=99.30 TRINITY_DN1410_c0_g2_i2:111-1016(+)
MGGQNVFFNVASKLLAVFCVTLAICIIFGTVFTYFHTVFPLILDLNTPIGCVNFLFASWLSFNLVFNYVMVLRTSCGVASKALLTPEELAQAEAHRGVQRARGEGFTLWCKHSDQPKPPRAHYCHVSGALVLKMDHFCPWVGQCVGHHNHRYFLLFLIYLWCSVAYAVVTILLHRWRFIENVRANEMLYRAEESTVTLCLVVCGALTAVISGFLGWSGYLAVSNQTTIEFIGNKARRKAAAERGELFIQPFDLGLKGNLQVVFGPFSSWWQALLPTADALPFDGHHWPARQSGPGETQTVF